MNQVIRITLIVGVAIVITLGLLTLGTAAVLEPKRPAPVQQDTTAVTPSGAGLASPAPACTAEQDYALELRTEGGQYEVSMLPDGNECEPVGEPIGPSPEVAAARDAALSYVVGRYGDQAPAPDLTWTLSGRAESVAPGGSPDEVTGSPDKVTYRFTAGTWIATVTFPVGGPGTVVYTVEISDQSTGFRWDGVVNATGDVTG